MKVIDTQLLLDEYAHLICAEGAKELPLLISGNSMSPFLIHGRDTVYLSPIERAVRRGDMILYRRENGQYVLHRVWTVEKETVTMVGDGQTALERGIRRDQLVAIVTHVTRKGKTLAPGSLWWEFFAKAWIRILPLRAPLCSLYKRCK